MILERSFYQQEVLTVARELLGKILVHESVEGVTSGRIVEAEAYMGPEDQAAHSSGGRRTARNEVMYGPKGHAYVYFIYGNHYCVNAVCLPAGQAEAVLIRAIEAEFCPELTLQRRPAVSSRDLTNGPGKLCQAMGIDRQLDGDDLCNPRSGLIIAENPQARNFRKRRRPQVTTTRIGITQAAALPLRFYLGGSQFVSRRAPPLARR